jgi:hypothetical protein
LSNCWIVGDTRILLFVVEILGLSSSGIEVVGVLGIVNVGNELDGTFEQVVPIDAF